MNEALIIGTCLLIAWASGLFADTMFEDGYATSGCLGIVGAVVFSVAGCVFLYRAVFP